MSKKKKIFLIFSTLGIVLIVGLVFFGLDFAVKQAVARSVEKSLGVKTELEDVDLALLQGDSRLRGLKIFNPPDFESPYFLYVDRMDADFSLMSLLNDRLTIPRMEIHGVGLNLESRNLKSNYGKIMEHLEQQKERDFPENASEEGRKFIIQEIVIRNVYISGGVDLLGSPQVGTSLKISEIRLENIGSESGGISLPQLIRLIVLTLLGTATEAGRDILPSNLVKTLGEGLGKLENLGIAGIKFLGTQAIKGVGIVTEQVGNVFEGIGNLFGGDAAKEDEEEDS